MTDIIEVLKKAIGMKASDIHVTVNLPIMVRVNGVLKRLDDNKLTPDDAIQYSMQLMNEQQSARFEATGEVDFSYAIPHLSRFRVNLYKQRGSVSIAIRVNFVKIPSTEDLGFPDVIREMALKPRGLILVTGPTGCGKTTTLASMLGHINQNRNCHVITLEEPIEYLHSHNKSIINQREVGSDTLNFANGLRAALREDPDVILVGEMRDFETISTVITAAETGHFVMSTLHTLDAASSIDRMVDVFPSYQQQQIKVQLSNVLQGIISQQLLPAMNGLGRVAALEILVATDAVRNLIREGKTHQIDTVIQSGARFGMRSMDYSLSELVRNNTVLKEDAEAKCVDHELFRRYLYQTAYGI